MNLRSLGLLLISLLTTCLAEPISLLSDSDLSNTYQQQKIFEENIGDSSIPRFLTTEIWDKADAPGAGTQLIVETLHVDSLEELPEAWRWARRNNVPGGTVSSGEGIGDIAFIAEPYFAAFISSGVVVRLRLLPTFVDDAQAQGEFQQIYDTVLQRANLRGTLSLTPFEIEYQVQQEDPIIVSGKLSAPNSVQGGYRYELYDIDSNDLVAEIDWKAFVSTEFSVEFDVLHTGNYKLVIQATDALGRNSDFEHLFSIGEIESPEMIAVKDTSLSAKQPHQNEGANPLLTLEKIQGKATRSAVAFELADTNLNGLSRATLVLTVDPSQAVNGWGNGRTISAQAITTPWQEGNGWSFGLKKKDQIAGNGSGATWFSPADQDISNDSANSAVNWDGATSSVYPPTAPSVQIGNFQSGEVAFDVTTDVLNGAENGWLILKDQENVGSKVSFYSREGAAAAGNPDLAPRLILEFGDPVASAAPSNGLLTEIGLGSIGTKFRTIQNGNELRSVREILQDSPVAALAAEQMICEAARTNPVLNLTARTAYRSWLAEDLQVATVTRWAV